MPECNAAARAQGGGAGGAHLFDLVILQLGEVIGQELRGDHAGGRGRRAAGVEPASVLRSLGKQWSSGCCSAAPPPPPAAPPPRPGARRQLARSPLRAPVPGRVTAASRPTSSAPIGCRSPLQRRAVASGQGGGVRWPLPPAPEKGRATLRNPPRAGISLHVPHVGSRGGGGRLSPARTVTRGGAVPRRGAAGRCGEWGWRCRDERPKRTCC